MRLKNGDYMQHGHYIGNGFLSGQVWVGGTSESNRGNPEWMDVPFSMLSEDALRELRGEAYEILHFVVQASG